MKRVLEINFYKLAAIITFNLIVNDQFKAQSMNVTDTLKYKFSLISPCKNDWVGITEIEYKFLEAMNSNETKILLNYDPIIPDTNISQEYIEFYRVLGNKLNTQIQAFGKYYNFETSLNSPTNHLNAFTISGLTELFGEKFTTVVLYEYNKRGPEFLGVYYIHKKYGLVMTDFGCFYLRSDFELRHGKIRKRKVWN